MTEAVQRLGRGDIQLLQKLVWAAGRKSMRLRRKAARRKDKASAKAHAHMADHLGRVHLKLEEMGGGSSIQKIERLLRGLSEIADRAASAEELPADTADTREHEVAEAGT